MPRFIIEVPHDGSKQACDLAIKTFLASGSHFVTNADWGCSDGTHTAWMIVDLDTKDEALQIVPLLYRKSAKITELEKFVLGSANEILVNHQ